MQIHFVEVDSFLDFARFVCAFREYPLRVYAHKLHGKMVLSSRIVLSKSILAFYTDYQEGRYIEYDPKGGKETSRVVSSIQSTSDHAPIVHLDSLPFQIKYYKKTADKFKISKVLDLGNLARLTYDPEWPDNPKITLLCFPKGEKWIVGYMSVIELAETVYCFYYVELDEEPDKPFIKYSGHKGISAQFTDIFQHGFPYLPVVKLKKNHPLFGFIAKK
ncbi:hypothetical protein [Nitrosopumilus ureiphilus]|uniref:hypothetical protein n=1 Tax=Nitrosopumilus ureiphilus TaxID=1470067 RepID=UPI001FEA9744|nr:hypothetical protein [Nitrosopumilus ureiphilus]